MEKAMINILIIILPPNKINTPRGNFYHDVYETYLDEISRAPAEHPSCSSWFYFFQNRERPHPRFRKLYSQLISGVFRVGMRWYLNFGDPTIMAP
jgi:hypothetical protein